MTLTLSRTLPPGEYLEYLMRAEELRGRGERGGAAKEGGGRGKDWVELLSDTAAAYATLEKGEQAWPHHIFVSLACSPGLLHLHAMWTSSCRKPDPSP